MKRDGGSRREETDRYGEVSSGQSDELEQEVEEMRNGRVKARFRLQ